MRVVIAGGTGALGSRLTQALRARHHEVTILSRRAGGEGIVQWDPTDGSGAWTAAVRGADAVVNLVGDALDAGRWTEARKRAIHDSRIVPTRALANVVATASPPPAFVSASAVGIYGTRGDAVLTETASPGSDFLAGLCRHWEDEAMAAAAVARVVLLRTGLVLDRTAGALPRLALAFRCFLGGRLGSGRQWWPWIHADDWTELAVWTIAGATVSGALNVTAPAPVTNAEFARVLGRVLHRPSVLSVPAFALRVLLGEMADAVVLGGQRAVPRRALDGGYRFRYETLDRALDALYPGGR